MSRQRTKGTRYETHLLTLLRRIWPQARRAGTTLGGNDQGDFLNCGPWLIEAKHRATLAIPEWVRTADRKAGPLRPWLILTRTDKRSFPFDLAVMQATVALELIQKATLYDLMREH